MTQPAIEQEVERLRNLLHQSNRSNIENQEELLKLRKEVKALHTNNKRLMQFSNEVRCTVACDASIDVSASFSRKTTPHSLKGMTVESGTDLVHDCSVSWVRQRNDSLHSLQGSHHHPDESERNARSQPNGRNQGDPGSVPCHPFYTTLTHPIVETSTYRD